MSGHFLSVATFVMGGRAFVSIFLWILSAEWEEFVSISGRTECYRWDGV